MQVFCDMLYVCCASRQSQKVNGCVLLRCTQMDCQCDKLPKSGTYRLMWLPIFCAKQKHLDVQKKRQARLHLHKSRCLFLYADYGQNTPKNSKHLALRCIGRKGIKPIRQRVLIWQTAIQRLFVCLHRFYDLDMLWTNLACVDKCTAM